jgi:Na+/proline symporter
VGSIGVGYAMLAMVKVIDALEIFPGLGLAPGDHAKLWSVVAVSVLVLAYAGVAGLWGVVATDFFQFFLGMLGAILVAVFAVGHVGGLDDMVRLAQQNTEFDVLAFTPLTFGQGGFLGLGWSSVAQISGWTFVAYMVLQWWAFRRSDGGGEFIQRLAAAKDERDAERAAWFFNILHYVVRTWPWIVVAVVALVVYPELEDRELGYPKLMLDYLPAGLLGIVVASLLAAFMSTVSTLINWSASYITHDLYGRFVRPEAGQRELVAFARIASVLVTALGAAAAFFSQDITTVFRLVIAIGTGPGLVLILRWFWWRINAWAELAAMLAGFVVGFATSVWTGVDVTLFGTAVSIPPLRIADFGQRLFVTSLVTLAVWVPVMLLTRPEPDEKLDAFYRRVRPGGPGWRRQRERTGLAPAQDLGRDLQRVVAALLLLFGLMFAVGGLVMLRLGRFAGMSITAILGWAWLSRLKGPREASGV